MEEEMPPTARPADAGAELMLSWRDGDETAFETLVESYSGQVFALLTRFLGRHPGREDMVQEVFLRVIRARDRYEPRARFTTWLYRIVFNLCVNETQRSRSRETLSLDGSTQTDAEHEGSRPDVTDERVSDPSGHMAQVDVVDAVRAAIASLPEMQRMALVLAKYEDMPYAEIGRVLGSSEKAIKSLIHRAREALRARLAHFLAEELA
ncbi:MAG: RNA polymerase sigma-70 factor (ECF subfamily) [Planctomycetota bacterium]|jgi:RNA polymerase sigma-70 factor (ECF subfamily)